MSRRGFFITGTDTDAGKTLVTAALLLKAQQSGLACLGLKPVAAGCDYRNGQWLNSDALLHQQYSNPPLRYELHNPVALPGAIAPHIAAAQQQQSLSVSRLMSLCTPALNSAELVFTEGAGGWLVPLNDEETMADLARAIGDPVILVVGMKLGCINHALLTATAIRASGLPLAGWVANHLPPGMNAAHENLAFLRHWFNQQNVPLLGSIPILSNLNASDPQQLAHIATQLILPKSTEPD